jgi:DNA (cytosine-5)-methyltransferase 1
MATRPDRRYSVVELYAGTARSADAFRQWRRARVELLVDCDQLAGETYLLNRPTAPYLTTNVSRLTPPDVKALSGGRVDILLGCPPCQGFSDTGTRDSADPRNAHLTHFLRFVEYLRPLAVAMENVPLAADTRRFARFARRLDELGYLSTWGILNAAIRGSSQCRHRLIYVGIRKDVGVEPSLPSPGYGAAGRYFSYRHGDLRRVDEDRITLLSEAPAVRRVRGSLPYREELLPLGPREIPTIGDALEGLPRVGSKRAEGLGHVEWDHTSRMRRRMSRVPEGGQWSGAADHFSQSYGRLHRRGLAPTVTTFFANAGSGRYWHPTENRALTLREAARLQGFPDSFRLMPTFASCKLVGNALDARLADVTYDVIRRSLT